jgi:hypothetical protein
MRAPAQTGEAEPANRTQPARLVTSAAQELLAIGGNSTNDTAVAGLGVDRPHR